MRDKSEWRTIFLIVICYAIWIGAVIGLAEVSTLVTVILLVPTITLHSSLQHECLHGHPFRSQLLNDAIVSIPLGLFIPYLRFKDSHLKHHLNSRICDPYDDPESWYLAQPFWQRLPVFFKLMLQLNNTLIGRLVLGPAIALVRLIVSDCQAIFAGHTSVRNAWITHIVLAVPVLCVVTWWSPLHLSYYLVCCYGGLSLLMIRTYLEHQAEESVRARSVIIEDCGIFSLLFLNNNLHAVHHAYPAVAWHKLPELYSSNRKRFLAMNKGYRFDNYWQIIRLFALRQKEPVIYPSKPGHLK